MPYIPDNLDAFNAWDREQNRKLEQLPVCEDCQEHIQDETAYYIDGCWICEDCMEAYRRDVLPE